MWVRVPPAAPIPFYSDFECRSDPPDVTLCADRRLMDDAYVYLLGVYLGDGTLTLAPRRVWRLRIAQDKRYPEIIHEIRWAMTEVSGAASGLISRPGCFEIYSNWKHWLCLFPQHAPGRKHERPIALEPWQVDLVRSYPLALIRGLIQSDGCRVTNRVRRPSRNGWRRYEYPRYFFTNASPDIRTIFSNACALAGIECRPNNERNLSVARKDSVSLLDAVIGPKR
jgi:hypothetical protein